MGGCSSTEHVVDSNLSDCSTPSILDASVTEGNDKCSNVENEHILSIAVAEQVSVCENYLDDQQNSVDCKDISVNKVNLAGSFTTGLKDSATEVLVESITTNNSAAVIVPEVNKNVAGMVDEEEENGVYHAAPSEVIPASINRSMTPVLQAPPIPSVFTGFIFKQGHVFKSMQYRYIVLSQGKLK